MPDPRRKVTAKKGAEGVCHTGDPMLDLFLASALAAAPQAPSATRYYVDALHATASTVQPPTATYDERLRSSGMKMLLDSIDGRGELAVGYGKSFTDALNLTGAYDAKSGVRVDQGSAAYAVSQPIFNPTWSGVQQWMTHGFDFADQPVTTATTQPSPSPTPDTLKTIATVTAIDPGAYHISDGGAASCAYGAPGHRLLLRALGDPQTHPLTSVVVDTQTMRFCTMNFRYGSPSAMSLTASFTLNLGPVQRYWMITDGTIDVQARALGISVVHSHITFAYNDVTVPANS
jgi:hypothetical protein